MTISWYSITISDGNGHPIFDGYFSVDNNFVTGFFDLSIHTNDSYTNVMLPKNDLASYVGSTNYYPFDNAGLNFYSTALQNYFGKSQNHFNIYGNTATGNAGTLYQEPFDLPFTYSSRFGTINGPPSPPILGPITCFKEDTKILTDKGYKPIQDLRKGDLVKTLNHDYKAIDMIGKREIYHPALQERIKDQLYKCSQSEYTEIFEPLIITGCHSILVDSFINEDQKQKVIEIYGGNIYVTDRKYRLPACADPRASIYETPGTYTIYHLALENDDYYMNYGVYANGLLVETCSKRYLKELSNMTLIE